MQKLAPGVRFKPWFKSLFFAQNWEHAEMLENCLFSILGFIIGYTKRAAVEVISEGVKGRVQVISEGVKKVANVKYCFKWGEYVIRCNLLPKMRREANSV